MFELKAIKWLMGRKVGKSSKSMLAAHLSINLEDGYSHPHDPSDLNRCFILLETIPEIRNSFNKIANISKEWKLIIENWEDLKILFEEEAGRDWCKGRSAPITYKRMRDLFDLS